MGGAIRLRHAHNGRLLYISYQIGSISVETTPGTGQLFGESRRFCREGKRKYRSLEEVLKALDDGIADWLEEHG